MNQNGLLSGSSAPLMSDPVCGMMNGGGWSPSFGNVTEWKPAKRHCTRSPLWIVIVLRKNWFESASGGTPAGRSATGGPATTSLVAADALGASTKTPATTAAASTPPRRMSLPLSGDCHAGSTGRPGAAYHYQIAGPAGRT